jgi:hypothetical protein
LYNQLLTLVQYVNCRYLRETQVGMLLSGFFDDMPMDGKIAIFLFSVAKWFFAT